MSKEQNAPRRTKPMQDRELVNILQAHVKNAMGYLSGDLAKQRALAMDYYLGEPLGNEVEGRSQVISTDVADAIEWILPSLIKIFLSTDDVVRFIPMNAQDEAAAEQETAYVNYKFQQCDKKKSGFLMLYSWFKDALLQKNGIIKVYWNETPTEKREEYEGLDELSFQMMVQDENNKLVAVTKNESEMVDPATGQPVPVVTYDAAFIHTEKKGAIQIDNIPPDEYLICKDHNSLFTDGATFVAHKWKKTVSELREMGYSDDIISRLPTYTTLQSEESIARNNLSDEKDSMAQDNNDEATREVEGYECFVYADRNGDGIAELLKANYSGDELLDDEEFKYSTNPLKTLTPIPLPHKHYGLSIADLLLDIQKIKSTLLRQTLDNMYLTNNPRTVIDQNKLNLDDLLVSRPGGVIRSNGDVMNSFAPFAVQPLGSAPFDMLEYMDKIREGRSGVSQTSQGLNADLINSNKGDSSVAMLMSAAQQRIELIARIFAETGVKDLFLYMHELLLKHQHQAEVIKLRGTWVEVNPAEWRERTQMMVNVGLGTGDRDKLVGAMTQLITLHAQVIQNGGLGTLVTQKNIYNAMRDACKFANIRNVDLYFTDPDSQEAQAAAQQQAAQAQQDKQNDPEAQWVKVEAEKAQLKAQQDQLEHEREMFKLEQQEAKMQMEFAQKQMELKQENIKNMQDFLVKLKEVNKPEPEPKPTKAQIIND